MTQKPSYLGSIPTAPLPDPIARNINAIIELHAREERDVPAHQRAVEKITTFFERPLFFYGLLVSITVWILINMLPLPGLHILGFDPPPFYGLGQVVDFGSLFITIGVLIRQTRQERLAEQRAQLMLQLNLLSEQKIAKLIALVEELRKDIPDIQNRYDPEAMVMQQAIDPQNVLDTLEENLNRELSELKEETSSATEE